MASSRNNSMSTLTTPTLSLHLNSHSDPEDGNNPTEEHKSRNSKIEPCSSLSTEVITLPLLLNTSTTMPSPTNTLPTGSSSDSMLVQPQLLPSSSNASSFSSSSSLTTASASNTSLTSSSTSSKALMSTRSSSPSYSLSQGPSLPMPSISSTPTYDTIAPTTTTTTTGHDNTDGVNMADANSNSGTGPAMMTTTTNTRSTTCFKRTSKITTKKLTKTHTTSNHKSYIPAPTAFSKLTSLPSSTPTLSSPIPSSHNASSSFALIPSHSSFADPYSTPTLSSSLDSSSTSKSMDLLHAVQTEDLPLLKSLLLKPNMDVHITDPKKRSLLHVATLRKHRGIVRFLLTNAIVSPNVLDGKQMTPLALCLSQQKWFDPIVCSLLIEHGGTTAPKPLVEVMGWALKHADPLNFKKLLHAWTPVHANVVHIRAKEGWAPIQIATNLGRTDMVSILLEYGANVNEVGALEWPSLHISARSGNESMVKVLLEAQANVHYATKEGRTALHMACEKGHLNVVPLLLEYGAHLNVQDIDGLTPLAYALLQPKLSVLEHLVEWGASLTLRTKSNESLVDLALQNGQVEFACFFRHRGVPASNFSNISSLDFIVESFNAVSTLSVQEHHTFFMQWLDSHLTTSSTMASLLSPPHPSSKTLNRFIQTRSNSHSSMEYDPTSISMSFSNSPPKNQVETTSSFSFHAKTLSELEDDMTHAEVADSMSSSSPFSCSLSLNKEKQQPEKQNAPSQPSTMTTSPPTPAPSSTPNLTSTSPSTTSLPPPTAPLSSLNVDTSDAFETCRKLLLRFHLPSTVLRHLDEAYTLSLIHPDVQPLHTMLQQLILFFQPFVTPFLQLETEVTQLQRQRTEVAQQLQHLIQAQSKFDDLTYLQELPSSSSSSFVEMMKLEDQWIQQMVQALMEETQLMCLVNQWMDQCHSLKHSLATQSKPELDPFLLKQQQVQLINQKHRIQSSKIQLDTAITELQHQWQSKLTEPWLVYFLNLFRPFQPTMVVEPTTTPAPTSSSSSASLACSTTIPHSTTPTPHSSSTLPSLDSVTSSTVPIMKPSAIPPTSTTKPNPTVLLEHLFAWYSQEKQSIFQTQLSHLDQELANSEMQANLTQFMHDVLEQTLQHVFDQLHRHLDTFHCLSKQLHQSLPFHYQPLHKRLMSNELACKTYLSSVQTELRQVLMAKNGSLRHRQVAELARLEERAEHWYTILDREEKRLLHLESMIQKAFLLIQPHVEVAQLEAIRNDFLNVGLTLRVGVKRLRRLDSSMDSQGDQVNSASTLGSIKLEGNPFSDAGSDPAKRTKLNKNEGNPDEENDSEKEEKEEEEEEATWPPLKKRKMEPSRSMPSTLLSQYHLSLDLKKETSSLPSSPFSSPISMDSSSPSFWQQLKGLPKSLFSFRRSHSSSSLSEVENTTTPQTHDSSMSSSSSSTPFFSSSSSFLSQPMDSEDDEMKNEEEFIKEKENQNHVHTSLCAPLNASTHFNINTQKKKDAAIFLSSTSLPSGSKLKGKVEFQDPIEQNSKS